MRDFLGHKKVTKPQTGLYKAVLAPKLSFGVINYQSAEFIIENAYMDKNAPCLTGAQ
jgi:hypothetical protein